MMQPSALRREPESQGNAPGLPPFSKVIAQELDRVERILRDELHSRYAFVNTLVDHVSSYRGKRLRPTLLLLSAKAAGEVVDAHLVLAAVVEMIHTATLVHDDVLDDAVVRRHKATVNAEWGAESSVLLGDFLFTHAFHLAASLPSTLACRLIGRATNIVCEGELHQIHHRGNLELTEAEYFDIIDGKTAELCSVSCQLGAHFAGASPATEDGFARYGRNLGVAFQIADDLLDLVGEEKSTGKSLGTDVDQQKLTLPLIWLLRTAPPTTAHTVQRILTSDDVGRRTELKPILEETGALAYARRRAEQFAAAAHHEIAALADSSAKHVLTQLTQFVTRRSS
jgi:octaprenyl-diphosphate synthase